MFTYTYTARDAKTGSKITAELQAESEAGATRLLTDRGLSPLEINVKTEKTGALAAFKNRIPTKQKVLFSRQLSTLINAGLPLVQSLSTVMGQTSHKPLKAVIAKVISDVEAGSALSDSLARHPKVFDHVYISLVAAGEASGTLDKSLERLANQQEKDAEIVSKVRGAMTYPLIVLVVLGGVMIFMLTTVLPQVTVLYQTIPGAQLPLITRLLLGVSQAITHFWWATLLVLLIAGFTVFRWYKTGTGKIVVDSLKMKMWPIGPLFMKLYMARFSRTASTLAGSGVPMIQMLNVAAEAVGNRHIAESINKAATQVQGGKSLSESLKDDPNFLELVPNMINIGEQSGQLDVMLGRVADYYEKEVDSQIKSVSTIIEPAMMIVVGIMAMIIVAGVLLPIYSLAGKNIVH